MIFLPVVERELRVAARKRSTFWARIGGAVFLALIGTGFLILLDTTGSTTVLTTMGKTLFTVLTSISLAAALFAGFFFTSDCLSEEKREGTLGFLFLTDLRGYDVVLGKFIAMSLCSFYTFLSALPILGITLLMGGVTGTEFWRTSVALLNALFISLSAGMFVSSISRQSQKAMGATFLLVLLICALGPSLDSALLPGASDPLLSLSSPVFLFSEARAFGRTHFWESLLVNQFLGWLMLALSCIYLPRTWQVKASRSAMAAEKWSRRWTFGSSEFRSRLRLRLMDRNPVLWIVCRERWQTVSIWIIALILLAGLIVALAFDEIGLWFAWSYLGGLVILLFYLGIASLSTRFFAEAQRGGLTELLLSTPLTEKHIVQGHWQALRRLLAIPLIFCLAVQFIGSHIASQKTRQVFAAPPPAVPAGVTVTVTNADGTISTSTSSTTVVSRTTVIGPGGVSVSFGDETDLLAALKALLSISTILINLVALCWVGMWMGMTSRNATMATFKTIIFVQILPWFGIAFFSTLITAALMADQWSGGRFSHWYQLYSALATFGLCLLKDSIFIVWARRRLYTDFRARANRSGAAVHTTLPPIIPTQPAPAPTN